MNQGVLLSFLMAGILFSGPTVAQPGKGGTEWVVKEVSSWFAGEESGFSEIPSELENLWDLSREQVKILAPAVWEGYAKSPMAKSLLKSIPAPDLNIKSSQPQRHDLELGEKTMPI